jgi:hypothetical protein
MTSWAPTLTALDVPIITEGPFTPQDNEVDERSNLDTGKFRPDEGKSEEELASFSGGNSETAAVTTEADTQNLGENIGKINESVTNSAATKRAAPQLTNVDTAGEQEYWENNSSEEEETRQMPSYGFTRSSLYATSARTPPTPEEGSEEAIREARELMKMAKSANSVYQAMIGGERREITVEDLNFWEKKLVGKMKTDETKRSTFTEEENEQHYAKKVQKEKQREAEKKSLQEQASKEKFEKLSPSEKLALVMGAKQHIVISDKDRATRVRLAKAADLKRQEELEAANKETPEQVEARQAEAKRVQAALKIMLLRYFFYYVFFVNRYCIITS